MTLGRKALAMAVAAALLVLLPTTARAKPPDGASPDTPGTSSSVSPRQLAPGARLAFSVQGFPAGETINIKIDDGDYCSQAAVHGACVVHTQKIRADGTVSGDFRLPVDIGPGAHWLRYLASTPIVGADGSAQGVKGFTLRGGSDFTVAAAGPAAPAPAPAAPAPAPAGPAPAAAAPAPAAPAAPAPAPGPVDPAPAPAEGAAPATGASGAPATSVPSAAGATSGAEVRTTAADADGSSDGVAFVLAIAVVVLVVGGGAMIVLIRRRPKPPRGRG